MEREELIERLKGYEWTDVEVKEAHGGVPKSAYETVSAFANTKGGWLVFGVREVGGRASRSSAFRKWTRSRTTSSASSVPARS